MDADESRQLLSGMLRAVANHDRSAFAALYRLTSAKLFGICLRMLPQRSDAEDVLQEVYVTVWHKATLYDGQRASPITWLAMIARNKSIDRLRVSGVERHNEPIELLERMHEPEPASDPVEIDAERRRLDQCLAALEDRQRCVIRTAFFDGCTYEELASRSGVPLGTMKSWIRRGLLRLKECLEK
ncbi:sigma-70 family RNA polymerase sigma factor [Pseudomonas cavernae]|uniref:RNA polymerase sigma factor n=2 Tax=Pseudomonas cavernae TaxID=2320867 RepID=A0A385Z7F5_9PSED|nr:sigma-70 family RNA polymerase sigma factor [Pseudomonas cavernae]